MTETKLQKYPRTPYCPFSPSLPEGALVIDTEKLVGTKVVLTEKLDGSNVVLYEGFAYTRSVTSNSRQPWLAMVRKHHAWKTSDYPDTQFYGEDLYGVHSIEYDAMLEERTFRLFAVRGEDTWAAWEEVQKWATLLNVPTVPLIAETTFVDTKQIQQTVEKLMKTPSALGAIKEGIVIRKADAFNRSEFQQSVCKAVRPNHVQPDQEHWSQNWTTCQITQK